MPKVKVIPFDPQRFVDRSDDSDLRITREFTDGVHRMPRFHPPVGGADHRPKSDYEAVMRAGLDEPQPSVENLQDFRDYLDKVFDERLTFRERMVIEGLFWEGESLRSLAPRLHVQKSTVHNIKQSALGKLEAWVLAFQRGEA